MKDFIKKYWILILIFSLINIPILVICCYRTNKTITLKGDTTIIEKFVEIDREYTEEGSFSSIYVISMDHSTIFQNMIVKDSKVNDLNDIYQGYLHLTDAETRQMSKIQHESSINYTLICAYENAKLVNPEIKFDYKFDHYRIAYYLEGSEFRIGDKIVGVNGIYAKDDFETFKELFNNANSSKDGESEYIVMRDGLKKIIKNTNENMKVSGYSFYTISDSVFPTYKIKTSNVGGPSGGLLQTLALYNSLTDEDITKGLKIAGTGTIDRSGNVGKIGGITQKIFTANDDKMDVFLCPKDNYEEALKAYKTLKNTKMKLYMVETFSDALEVLKNA